MNEDNNSEVPSGNADPDFANRRKLVQAAIEQWRNQLVDLGGRNNLLYFKETSKGSIIFSEESGVDVSRLKDLIVTSHMKLNDLFRDDPEQRDRALRKARDASKKAIENREERGLETLYLAWGFATWDGERSKSVPNAPVLLKPVNLQIQGRGGLEIEIILQDSWIINPTFLQAMSSDFGATFKASEFEDLLDGVNETSNASVIFEVLMRRMDEVPGFAVNPKLAISNFSYANLAMVEDLSMSEAVMMDSLLISAIVGDVKAREALRAKQASLSVPDPDSIAPQDEFLVLDADASQSYVINASVAGANLVVEGPPGTGKSQTIANLIATLSARGIRSLFVAEKRAAIDAVLKRLENVGLRELVLDLHDTSGSRRKIIEDLDNSLRSVGLVPFTNFQSTHSELERKREELISRANVLRDKREPWGISLSEIYGELPEFQDQLLLESLITRSDVKRINQEFLRELQGHLERFALLQGLSLVNKKSLWSKAFSERSIKSIEDSEMALELISELPSFLDKLEIENEALNNEITSFKVESISDFSLTSELFSDIESRTQIFELGIYAEPLELLISQLEPCKGGVPKRIISAATDSDYRAALKTVKRHLKIQKLEPAELFNQVEKTLSEKKRWDQQQFQGSSEIFLPNNSASFQRATQKVLDALEELWRFIDSSTTSYLRLNLDELSNYLEGLFSERDIAIRMFEIDEIYQKLSNSGLSKIIGEIANRSLSPEEARKSLRCSWLLSILDSLKKSDPRILSFVGDVHQSTVDHFHDLDSEHITKNPQRIRRLVAERVTKARDDFPEESELVAHQARIRRKNISIRQLREQAPHVLGALKPCWAMSPLVVSQVLPPGQIFDVVIFDEASQVTPAGAVGALSRAPQAIVAGDPHQLPPSNFFISSAGNSVSDDSDEGADLDVDEQENTAQPLTADIESILDVMSALLPPPNGTKTLNWHYRSKDERLIGFSNAQDSLYRGSLTTFPGTIVKSPVSLEVAEHRMDSNSNSVSSTAEVELVVRLIQKHAALRTDESLGVIALGIKHANRIEEALRLARMTDSTLDDYLSSKPNNESFFIKNLERVQGDEREAIILTVGYGKNSDGRMKYSFGPINNEGGERRLNVAVTRARSRMTIVSSFTAQEMDPQKLKSEGPRMLQRLLAYAASGGSDLGPNFKETPEMNPFERDVLRHLEDAGLSLIPQYGVSGYWIDFAVQHPERPGEMILAIEADGAMYHSSISARNRDRLRQDHLERLGWRFHRIWSQEWFQHRESEIVSAVEAYKQAIRISDEKLNSTSSVDEVSVPKEKIYNNPERKKRPSIMRLPEISDYSRTDLAELIQWLESDTLVRTKEQLIDEAVKELGFARRGPRIIAALEQAIRDSKKFRNIYDEEQK